ncbi:hypothetical protein NCLIV_018770 [Neospora caninum Liverpool]|uniref:Transmembrane protein n=1 Tax=Neospora caninum (strain Liverpool) TaxID=572307 RepID=F0VEE3_NEOCL|nr:hypothetical protein NCLIV_018770 [Neospora caninum Liverpool]CBZ52087.1 hypothetical protein NCLIV_018770 [Neospora caninum Liverpool]CEL66049.1 TPA: hypothetical protein BN1204_018770 [Neospora caninum Liverpool]|eukprot:XP_003882119.1 hypothetical protein NCLIV_018770 [Neospora caninum Liverpool]
MNRVSKCAVVAGSSLLGALSSLVPRYPSASLSVSPMFTRKALLVPLALAASLFNFLAAAGNHGDSLATGTATAELPGAPQDTPPLLWNGAGPGASRPGIGAGRSRNATLPWRRKRPLAASEDEGALGAASLRGNPSGLFSNTLETAENGAIQVERQAAAEMASAKEDSQTLTRRMRAAWRPWATSTDRRVSFFDITILLIALVITGVTTNWMRGLRIKVAHAVGAEFRDVVLGRLADPA